MPVKRQIKDSFGIYFITFTCFNFLPLIQITNGYNFIYKWFDYLIQNGHYIIGYVIMPNHVHALIGFCNSGKSINTIIGNGKRFMAYDIIKRLEQQHEIKLLQRLSEAVETKDLQRNKKHEVWEDSFDWKDCRNQSFIIQKLDYIHKNPCRGKWKIVEKLSEYDHSSARYYMEGIHASYPVTNFMEMNDVDLSKPRNNNAESTTQSQGNM